MLLDYILSLSLSSSLNRREQAIDTVLACLHRLQKKAVLQNWNEFHFKEVKIHKFHQTHQMLVKQNENVAIDISWRHATRPWWSIRERRKAQLGSVNGRVSSSSQMSTMSLWYPDRDTQNLASCFFGTLYHCLCMPSPSHTWTSISHSWVLWGMIEECMSWAFKIFYSQTFDSGSV